MDNHSVYTVRCSDNSLYIGYANNIEVRIDKYNAGKGAKYTKARRPAVLVYQEVYKTKSEALRRKYEIKIFTRQGKLKLIEEG